MSIQIKTNKQGRRNSNDDPSDEVLKRIATEMGIDITDLFDQPAKDVVNCPYCGGKIKVGKG